MSSGGFASSKSGWPLAGGVADSPRTRDRARTSGVFTPVSAWASLHPSLGYRVVVHTRCTEGRRSRRAGISMTTEPIQADALPRAGGTSATVPDQRCGDLSGQLLIGFVVTAERRCLSDAARALYRSPSALCRQITHLERLLGYPLFVRSSRGLHLTMEGTALLPRARAALGALETLFEPVTAASVPGQREPPSASCSLSPETTL